MSVIVLLHFPIADIAKAKQTIASRADLLEEITEDSKKLGAQHHRRHGLHRPQPQRPARAR